MIYRYTIGSVCCLLGSLALFWCTRTPRPATVTPAATKTPEAARPASPSKELPASPSLSASPAVSTLHVDNLAAELRGFPTNECSGPCEAALRTLAGRLEATALASALGAGDTNLAPDARRVWRQILLTRMAGASSEIALQAVTYAQTLVSPLEREEAFRTVLITRAQ